VSTVNKNDDCLQVMELSLNLVCPCNNKSYKTEQTLKAHRKTQGHQYWEQSKEQKDRDVRIKRLENENANLRRLNFILLERIDKNVTL
jgi:hypothetical protein